VRVQSLLLGLDARREAARQKAAEAAAQEEAEEAAWIEAEVCMFAQGMEATLGVTGHASHPCNTCKPR
jgi:hypothetical protein